MKVNSFDEIYSNTLWQLLTCPDDVIDGKDGFREITGFQFKLDLSNEDYTITHNNNRKFNLEYAIDFFNYIMYGTEFKEVNLSARAKGFLGEFDGRNTQYGPRIHTQMEELLEELMYDKNTRRGSMLILNSEDQELLAPKREGKTTIEYPCTNSLTFSIRDNKLNLVSNMRSQSACMVMPYDIFNWVNLMKYVCEKLISTYPDLEIGTLVHQVASMHVYNNEVELSKSILAEYGLLV